MSTPSEAQITLIAETYRLLGDATRLKILLCCMDGSIAVSDIAAAIEASPSLVSHNLRLLREARLVRGVRKSKQVFYEVDDGHIRHMLTDMIDHVSEQQS